MQRLDQIGMLLSTLIDRSLCEYTVAEFNYRIIAQNILTRETFQNLTLHLEGQLLLLLLQVQVQQQLQVLRPLVQPPPLVLMELRLPQLAHHWNEIISKVDMDINNIMFVGVGPVKENILCQIDHLHFVRHVVLRCGKYSGFMSNKVIPAGRRAEFTPYAFIHIQINRRL